MMLTGARSILIVDDDPSIRSYLQELFKASGYDPSGASNAEEGLQRASDKEFEVVLLDIRLPDQSGLEVLQRLHWEHPDTAVIMVTGFAEVETAVAALKAGAYDYIVKPFRMDDVLVRVEKAREKRLLALQVKDYQKNLEAKVAEYRRDLHKVMATTIQGLIEEATRTEAWEPKKGERASAPGDQGIRELGAKIMRLFKGKGR